jgi:hypothetical protein
MASLYCQSCVLTTCILTCCPPAPEASAGNMCRHRALRLYVGTPSLEGMASLYCQSCVLTKCILTCCPPAPRLRRVICADIERISRSEEREARGKGQKRDKEGIRAIRGGKGGRRDSRGFGTPGTGVPAGIGGCHIAVRRPRRAWESCPTAPSRRTAKNRLPEKIILQNQPLPWRPPRRVLRRRRVRRGGSLCRRRWRPRRQFATTWLLSVRLRRRLFASSGCCGARRT